MPGCTRGTLGTWTASPQPHLVGVLQASGLAQSRLVPGEGQSHTVSLSAVPAGGQSSLQKDPKEPGVSQNRLHQYRPRVCRSHQGARQTNPPPRSLGMGGTSARTVPESQGIPWMNSTAGGEDKPLGPPRPEATRSSPHTFPHVCPETGGFVTHNPKRPKETRQEQRDGTQDPRQAHACFPPPTPCPAAAGQAAIPGRNHHTSSWVSGCVRRTWPLHCVTCSIEGSVLSDLLSPHLESVTSSRVGMGPCCLPHLCILSDQRWAWC